MKKILFVIDTLEMGGAEKSILDIASRFKKYTPVVCHLYPGDSLKSDYVARGIEVISLNVSGHYNFREATKRLQQIVHTVQPKVIHSTLFRSDIVARRLRRNGQPLVNSLVNNTYHSSRFQNAVLLMKLKLKVLQALDAFTARRADLFISNSVAIKNSNAKALGIPLEKILVIYRGRSINRFMTVVSSDVETLRKSLNIEGRKVLLNVSRLLERKGQLDLLRAFQRVVLQTPDVVLLIAGEGPFRKVLEAEVDALGLRGKVFLLGTRADVPMLLKLADAFVFPSHYEGLPGALIEAMMSQTPIVASDIPENLECVGEKEALIHRVGDAADLGRCISEVLHNREKSMTRSLAAFAQAQQKFEIDAIAAQYESTYDELLKP
ncbi:glycosyltransferase [Chryseolinea lacunae]|uniref:Glycosyltransferase n=1 Tax=Chryseolinea lacunae TaxID=2801331 RepID=A0ABS1KXK1_9BACT|nr:glycosyltransferase [Chryseolinea lacunae]MBL0744023.1 glycosyltransferase [Chryseolinea lacunae]